MPAALTEDAVEPLARGMEHSTSSGPSGSSPASRRISRIRAAAAAAAGGSSARMTPRLAESETGLTTQGEPTSAASARAARAFGGDGGGETKLDELLENERRTLAPAERAIRSHRYLDALAAGRVPESSLRALRRRAVLSHPATGAASRTLPGAFPSRVVYS